MGGQEIEGVGGASVEGGNRDILGRFEGGLYGTLPDDTTADFEPMLEEDLLGALDFLL